MELTVRTVRADEWRQVRDLRLAALLDPAAPIAFLETHEAAAAEPDDFWKARTERGAGGVLVQQFVAEGADGRWEGTVTALVERPGSETAFGEAAEVVQTHLVGVFVRPEQRGSGLAQQLFRSALEWSWAVPVERVRLYVHEANLRAEAMYRSAGFRRTGRSVTVPGSADGREWEMAVDRPAGAARP